MLQIPDGECLIRYSDQHEDAVRDEIMVGWEDDFVGKPLGAECPSAGHCNFLAIMNLVNGEVVTQDYDGRCAIGKIPRD
jgi:hypothetical protein